MSNKVKKGSALVTVLIFSVLFIVISGVSAIAVVNTLKGNSGEEVYQTLYYEAEAGIEKALAEYKKDGDSIQPRFSINDANMIGDVEISVTKNGTYFQVESTSTKRNSSQSRTVKAKIKKYIYPNDIFRYSICGKKVFVTGNGSINLNPSLINSSDDKAIVGAEDLDPGSEVNEEFTLPIFDESRIPHADSLEFDVHETSLKPQLDLMSMDPNRPVRKILLPYPYFEVYLINADKVKISSSRGFTDESIMLLSGGDLELVLDYPAQMHKSSIVSKTVTVGKSNLQMSYRPYNEDYPDGSNLIHETLKKSDLEKLMNGYVDTNGNYVKGISYYAPNYSYDGDPSGGDLSINVSDYE